MANNHISSFIRYRRATGLDALCITCAGLVEASARTGDLKFHLLGVHKANKPTSLPAWLRCIKAAGRLRHCLDGRRQTALVSSGLVLVNDFLVSDAIHSAHGIFVDSLGGSLVTCLDRLDDLFDRSAQLRA